MPLLRHTFLLLLLVAAVCTGTRSEAAPSRAGRVYADASFGIAGYDAEVDGAATVSGSHQYQQYTLQYDKRNLIQGGRAGYYDLMLGYEYTALDTELRDNGRELADASLTTDKVYYSGSLLIAPGGLPFRLTLYAYDRHRSSMSDDNSVTTPVGRQEGGNASLIDSDLYTDINNGTHRTLGGTLLLGIRNGSYLGAYRDLLAKMPRLLVDYKQVEVKDLLGEHDTDYLARDVAFVSLNKKDNWAHFRMHDFTDNLNAANNSKTTQVLIGTIDQYLQRQWINLTNWIKLSADGSYEVEKQATETVPTRTFSNHVFGLARLSQLQASAFLSASRTVDERSIAKEFDLPINVTYEPDRNSKYYLRFRGEAERRDWTGNLLDADGSSNTENSLYLSLSTELWRRQPVQLRTQLDAEQNNSESKRSTLLRLGGELASNSVANRGPSWVGGYRLTLINTTSSGAADDNSGQYTQHDLYGRIDQQLNANWRRGAKLALVVGTGPWQSSTGNITTINLSEISSRVGNNVSSRDTEKIVQTNLSTYLEHQRDTRQNRVSAELSTIATDSESLYILELRHLFKQRRQDSTFSWSTQGLWGNDVATQSETSDLDYTGLWEASEDQDYTFSLRTSGSYTYQPHRAVDFELMGSASTATGADKETYVYYGRESLTYRLFTANGVVRRLFEFNETLAYEAVSAALDGRTGALALQLGASYFPTKHWYGKLTSKWVEMLPYNALQQTYRAELGINYEKLLISMNYAWAEKAEEDEDRAAVMEQRWEFNVKKIF